MLEISLALRVVCNVVHVAGAKRVHQNPFLLSAHCRAWFSTKWHEGGGFPWAANVWRFQNTRDVPLPPKRRIRPVFMILTLCNDAREKYNFNWNPVLFTRWNSPCAMYVISILQRIAISSRTLLYLTVLYCILLYLWENAIVVESLTTWTMSVILPWL